jgi:hypothetical protein
VIKFSIVIWARFAESWENGCQATDKNVSDFVPVQDFEQRIGNRIRSLGISQGSAARDTTRRLAADRPRFGGGMAPRSGVGTASLHRCLPKSGVLASARVAKASAATRSVVPSSWGRTGGPGGTCQRSGTR